MSQLALAYTSNPDEVRSKANVRLGLSVRGRAGRQRDRFPSSMSFILSVKSKCGPAQRWTFPFQNI